MFSRKVVPNILHRVKFRGVGWQGQQRTVVGHTQSPPSLVPTVAVANQYGMGAGRSLGGGRFHMMAHGVGVDLGSQPHRGLVFQ